jgi:hypothetical protein
MTGTSIPDISASERETRALASLECDVQRPGMGWAEATFAASFGR